jgi:hypothetical protein
VRPRCIWMDSCGAQRAFDKVRRRGSSDVFLMLRRLARDPCARMDSNSEQFQARPVASTRVLSSGNGPSLGAVLPPRRIQAANDPKHGCMHWSYVYCYAVG